MDIVVDTSAVIAVIMGEPQRKEIIALTRGRQLIAPASIMPVTENSSSPLDVPSVKTGISMDDWMAVLHQERARSAQ